MDSTLSMNLLTRTTLRAVVAVGICLFCGQALAAGDPTVVILTHDSLQSTNRTLQGARKVIGREHPDAAFHSFMVMDDPGSQVFLLDSIGKLAPSVILTVGSAATRFACDNFKSLPIVFSAVKYPMLSGFVGTMKRPGGNVTGASLNIPVDVQFRYFSEVVPNLKSIGVLYTSNTASLITQAKVVAQSAGLELIAIEVNDVKELPQALDSLAAVADGMWAVADPNLFDPRSTRYILLNTIRKGLPFMGFSRHIVESGALFALDFDYKAIGLQAGEAVNRIVAGESPGSISVTLADIIWFHYNEKTAKHIDITMPEELVAIAKEVYR